MDKQMNKLFAEGGINTGKTTVDPVSGNEVPPGSLPSEVRDDVDAKLSGGEYVVPADVLRYYGVAFFEKLRTKAKAGLGEMDADGRIGGGTAPEEEEDFPFSVDELEAEDDMNFAEGGAVPDTAPAKPAFNPNDWAYGNSSNFGGPSGSTEVKKYKDKDGNVVQVLFINGKPVVDVNALGYTEYKEETPVATGEEVQTPKDMILNKDSSNKDTPPEADKDTPIDPAENYYNMAEEDLLGVDYKTIKDNKGLGIAAKIGTALLGPGVALGAGALKGFQDAQNLADARARKIIAQERNFDTTALDAKIKEMEDNASGFVKGLDVVGLDGKGIAGRHKKNAVNSGIAIPTPTTPPAVSKPLGGSSSGGGSGSGYQAPPATKTASTPSATKTVSTPSGNKTVNTTATTSGTRSYTSPTTQQLKDQKATSAGVNVGAYNAATSTKKGTPMAKGGLVERPKKVVASKPKRKTKI